VSYGFPIIFFCNSEVDYETSCIILHSSALMKGEISSVILLFHHITVLSYLWFCIEHDDCYIWPKHVADSWLQIKLCLDCVFALLPHLHVCLNTRGMPFPKINLTYCLQAR
jgi:hypothetical protein